MWKLKKVEQMLFYKAQHSLSGVSDVLLINGLGASLISLFI